MTTLQEYLSRSIAQRWAIPHFNISDIVTLHGIARAAKELKSPVMIGTSEGEREFVGLAVAVAAVAAASGEYGVPMFLNADHTFSVEKAKAAIDGGYRSVHVDLSKKSDEENMGGVKEVIAYAKNKGGNFSIEGEIGYLVTDASKVYKEAIEIPPESLTDPQKAKAYVEATAVNRLAPAVGTLHGIAANTPKIDIERIKKIREAVGSNITLVLHGGSGSTNEDMKAAVAAGMNCVHINTDIRVAYAKSLRQSLAGQAEETTPYKLLKPVIDAVAKTCAEKIELFGSASKI